MATSTKQTVATVEVYDYEVATGDPALINPPGIAGKRVKVTGYDRARAIAPNVWLGGVVYSTITDQNGFWHVFVVPTDNITPSNTVYLVEIEGKQSYRINPTLAGVPGVGWQTSAILVDIPATLSPTATTVGALTATGLLTASAGLTVVGAVTLPAASISDAALSANVALKNINNAFSVGQTITGTLVVTAGVTVNAGGLTVTAGGLAVSAGGAAITGNSTVTGTLTVTAGLIVNAGGVTATGFSAITADANNGLLVKASVAMPATNAVLLVQDDAGAQLLYVTKNGQTSLKLGTAVLPALSFAGRLTDGIFSPAANSVGIAANGLEVARFNSATGLIFPTDNTYDIGATGATRPRNLWVAGQATLGTSLYVAGDVGAGVAAQLGLTNVVGVGNGGALNAFNTVAKGTGSGPAAPTTVSTWMKVYNGVTVGWIPVMV